MPDTLTPPAPAKKVTSHVLYDVTIDLWKGSTYISNNRTDFHANTPNTIIGFWTHDFSQYESQDSPQQFVTKSLNNIKM